MIQGTPNKWTRREILKSSLTAGGVALFGFQALSSSGLREQSTRHPLSGGRPLKLIDFAGEGPIPMDVPMGSGLDGRLYTDLSSVDPDHPTIPNEKFYVRTRASDLLDERKPWLIKVWGSGIKQTSLDLGTIRKLSKPAGTRLMECSGNVRDARFGLLSVADWAGAPISNILGLAQIENPATRVLISGFDEYPDPSNTSIAGASWIFTVDELQNSEAFLATTMNGSSLPRDHGAPVRLVVPGWYGCTCIKWVNEIKVVDEDVPATSQMHEFSFRTMQPGEPELAKDYRPALIDQAAMPVRVEQWHTEGRFTYRVCGIAWGGSRLITGLKIRFNPDENFVPVDTFRQTSNDPWSFWTHVWRPVRRGIYSIELRLDNDSISARRLKAGYYRRSVEITEI
jgi:DMSO/TMAO reductase YedYZ molybdopterin-dependent catalytic subunit